MTKTAQMIAQQHKDTVAACEAAEAIAIAKDQV